MSSVRMLPMVFLLAGCAAAPPLAPPADMVGHEHGHHAEGVAYYATGGSQRHLQPLSEVFRIVRVQPAPDGFVGHLAYDGSSGRLWLLSFGPPANTRGASTLYEIDPSSGRLLAQKEMPFRGEFGAPLYLDGHLYVGIYHQRRIHQIAVADRAQMGRVVRTLELASINELDLSGHKDDVFRYPFFTFSSLVATPDGKLLTHSDDLGEFLTLDPQSGRVLRQVRTQPSLEGLSAAPGPKGEFLVLGNANPREFALKSYLRKFLFRGAQAAPPLTSDAPVEETGVTWMLLDPATGEVLSSIWHAPSRAMAKSIALVSHEKVAGTPYGRFRFLTLGREGILTVEWTPGTGAWSVIDRSSRSPR